MEFYVYIYLDPRCRKLFTYGQYTFNYEPFYVGKGKNNQYETHLKEAQIQNTTTNHIINISKLYKIKEILNENIEPIILKIKEKLSEKEAFKLESEIINIIGRTDKSLGPLLNQTDGGEGTTGFIYSDILKIKKSLIMKDKWKDETYRNNCIEGIKEKRNTPEYINNLKNNGKKQWKKLSKEKRKNEIDRLTLLVQKNVANGEWIENQRKNAVDQWNDPIKKKNHLDAMKKFRKYPDELFCKECGNQINRCSESKLCASCSKLGSRNPAYKNKVIVDKFCNKCERQLSKYNTTGLCNSCVRQGIKRKPYKLRSRSI